MVHSNVRLNQVNGGESQLALHELRRCVGKQGARRQPERRDDADTHQHGDGDKAPWHDVSAEILQGLR